MSIYSFDRYTDYLRSLSKGTDSVMSLREMAEAAGVQRPYISNVLVEKAHLNREQGFRLAQHLGLDESEINYFLNLIEIERASSSTYRDYLQTKSISLKQTSEQLVHKLKRKPIAMDQDRAVEYFSTWEYSAIHIFVSIPKFQTVRRIAKALHLTPKEVLYFLKKLENWHLITQENETYRWAAGNVHTPAGNPVTCLYQRTWRDKAVENAKAQSEKDIHFTSVYSMSIVDAEKLRKKILALVKDYNETASRSKEEDLVCFNVDFFGVANQGESTSHNS